MNKLVSIVFYCFLTLNSIGLFKIIPAAANDTTLEIQEFLYTNSTISTLTEIIPTIDQLMEGGLSASEICVVLDVHGTLTQDGYPAQNTIVRKGTIATLDALKERSIPMIYSSAWASVCTFRKTEQKELQDFDTILYDVAIIDKKFQVPDQHKVHYDSIVLQNQTFDYAQYKNVISVHLRDHYDNYSRHKSYAPFIYCDTLSLNLKALIFIDDSKKNISIFLDSLFDYNPYPALKRVDLVQISPELESDEEDSHASTSTN